METTTTLPLPWMRPAADASDRVSDVRDTSLAKLVRDDVLGRILGGELAPGQRINEPDVAARLGVSRVPVREALRELESSGLVQARKHAGVFVRQPSAQEIADCYELRALLDAHAGRRVAADASPALLAVLDASIATMAAAARAQDVAAYYAENLRFHWLLVEAAGNEAIARTYRDVVQRLHLARITNLKRIEGMEASIAEHEAIVRAIRDRDPERCADLMRTHVESAHRRLPAQR